ncbi:MAG: phytanoyl-CoA dioxygenase family protein [Verrucomicrobiota bacterium]|nr:phytanoyl-CoA dioxygenase family protein [Verrucomicrobiota bacterium]
MNTSILTQKNHGEIINASPEHFGSLRDSSDIFSNPLEIRQRMSEDGYLYFKGVLNHDDVIEARRELLEKMAKDGFVHPDFPLMEGISHPEKKIGFAPEYAMGSVALKNVVFGQTMMAFYQRLLGGEVRHFDFRWLRAVSGGLPGINPHCDIVYMGRGTSNLFTAWVPYGDTPMEMGTIMVLEDSHKKSPMIKRYLDRDVDTYCTNFSDAKDIESGKKSWPQFTFSGALSNSAARLQNKIGGRWLSADFKVGDFLSFGMRMIHSSLDNQTEKIRLSSDTRYQLASEPIDERWIGENPIAHGVAGKRGQIC